MKFGAAWLNVRGLLVLGGGIRSTECHSVNSYQTGVCCLHLKCRTQTCPRPLCQDISKYLFVALMCTHIKNTEPSKSLSLALVSTSASIRHLLPLLPCDYLKIALGCRALSEPRWSGFTSTQSSFHSLCLHSVIPFAFIGFLTFTSLFNLSFSLRLFNLSQSPSLHSSNFPISRKI